MGAAISNVRPKPDKVLVDTGLGFINRARRQQDFFRGRVMFPIFDAQDHPIGFGGRVLDPAGRPGPVWALGALRRGELWESTAVPEIRAQAQELASALLACGILETDEVLAVFSNSAPITIGAMFVFAMLAMIACLLLFLREIFLAVSTPRHVPR